MANDASAFLYWYRRYKVRAADMTTFQGAMVDASRGLAEGAVGAAVLSGMDVTSGVGLSVNVAAGIATSATGYLDIINATTAVDLSGATGALPTRSLIVVTATPTDANPITSPTAPFNQVPLNSIQRAIVQVLTGTPSLNPDYPAKGVNDTIICGVNIPPGTTQIDDSMIDFDVRESVGVNSTIAQNQVRFDNRLRPYRSSAAVLGIKPSQTFKPLGFSFLGRSTPSRYPLTAGSFTNSDSFANFSTGVISGGDGTSAPFTPPVLTGSQSVICAVLLTTDDLLQFEFGTPGTMAQCLNGISNQVESGPGSIPLFSESLLAYVIVTANGGVISDIQVHDARPFLGSGGGGGGGAFKEETPTGVINGSNAVFNLSALPLSKSGLFFLVDTNILTKNQFTLSGTQVTITDPDLIPDGAQTVYAKYQIGAPGPLITPPGYVPHGTVGSPIILNPGDSVSGSIDRLQTIWLASASGAMPVTGIPQIMPGNQIGDVMKIKGASSGNYAIFHDGDGLDLPGDLYLVLGQAAELSWDGLNWSLDSRRQ